MQRCLFLKRTLRGRSLCFVLEIFDDVTPPDTKSDGTLFGGVTTAVEDTTAGTVTAERPKRPRKKRPAVTDVSGSSYPPKKLRGDYWTSSEAVIGDKYSSDIKELLESSILSTEAGLSAMSTLPFVNSLVSATLEHKGGAPIDSVTGSNLRTIGPAVRFVISSDSSHHSNASEAEVDSIIRSDVPPPVTTKAVITTSVVRVPPVLRVADKVIPQVQQFIFHESSYADTIKLDDAGPSHLPRKKLSVGSREVDSENLREVFIPHWNVSNDALLDDLDTSREFIDHLAPPNDGLVDQVHALETTCSGLRTQVSGYEHLKEQIVEFQDAQINVVNEKVAKLDADLLEMACHLEEKIYPHLLTTISGRRWLLTHGMKLFLVKCLNLSEYLTALGAAISRAIEKGMQGGLAAGIDHGKEGRSLTDVSAYNPDAEADFNSALQKLREVDFPLLAELKSHKDASVEDIMNLIRLEGTLADAPGMSDLQPDVEQLRIPIHKSEDQVVLDETSLSFALSVSHSRMERIRENITAQRSALISESGQGNVQEDVQGDAQGDVASFSTIEFEKEELDTTPECDPPS
ncbi:hypothetical protein Tco_0007296 [Tanacetum coccineum]